MGYFRTDKCLTDSNRISVVTYDKLLATVRTDLELLRDIVKNSAT